MGILEDGDGRRIGLHPRHLVGRSRRMHTRLAISEASAQHAVVTWTGERWCVRDLGSRNGTFVRGEAIPSGEDVPVAAGDTLAFGKEEVGWRLVDDGAPVPFGRADDELVFGEGDVLGLPSLDQPDVLIQLDDEGWVCTDAQRRYDVHDGELVVADGRAWELGLPEQTVATAAVGFTLDDVGLDFRVSRDEEYVEVCVRMGGSQVDLAPKAHHYILLVLARSRLEDVEAGTPESAQGWLYSKALQKMLRLDRNRINLGLHRARRELLDLGITDGKQLVERRSTSHQVRIGVRDLTVDRL